MFLIEGKEGRTLRFFRTSHYGGEISQISVIEWVGYEKKLALSFGINAFVMLTASLLLWLDKHPVVIGMGLIGLQVAHLLWKVLFVWKHIQIRTEQSSVIFLAPMVACWEHMLFFSSIAFLMAIVAKHIEYLNPTLLLFLVAVVLIFSALPILNVIVSNLMKHDAK